MPKLNESDWLAAPNLSLRRVGDEHVGACPVCQGGDDRFRVSAAGAFCRVCCPDGTDTDAFMRLVTAAGLNGQQPLIRRLPLGSAAEKVTEYEIRDTAGELQAVHGRRDKLIGKDLWWRLPDGTTGLGGRKTRTLPLYRSQHITGTKATAVCIVEGEKAADALASAVSTMLVLGTITGASSVPDAEVLQPVIDTGLPVYLWPDRDAEGAKHMQRVAALIPGALVIADAPPDTKGADAADWARLTDRPSWESLVATAVAWSAAPPAPAPSTPTTPVASFDVTAGEVARRVIDTAGDKLLIVDDGDYGTGYLVDERGIWLGGGAVWVAVLMVIERQMLGDLIASGLTGKALMAAVAQVQRLKRPGMVEQVRPMLRGTLLDMRASDPAAAPGVTECQLPDLDANMRYMGAMNGVIDLHAGTLMPPTDGRLALVTIAAPVAFDEDAVHDDVHRLFAHLEPEAVNWWWRVLGFHLLGSPSRRFYVVVGPPNGGKTTLANAIAGTLGPYASRPADDALEARPGGSAGLSPELEAFTVPRRWALIDEAPRLKIAAPLLKRLSGDGSQTFRRLHEQLRTVPATATVLLICNPESVPRFRLQDEAMADRLRELPYPPVRDLEPGFKERIKTDEFRRAFLAKLVAAAAGEKPGEPPDAPSLVLQASADRIAEDVGELGAFARRIVRGSAVLTITDLWKAWCEHHEELPVVSEAGGIGKRRLSSALRGHVPGLPAAKAFSNAGAKVRGWRGWELLDEALEQDAPPPLFGSNGTKKYRIHAFQSKPADIVPQLLSELAQLVGPRAIRDAWCSATYAWMDAGEHRDAAGNPAGDWDESFTDGVYRVTWTPPPNETPTLPGIDEDEKERLDKAATITGGLY